MSDSSSTTEVAPDPSQNGDGPETSPAESRDSSRLFEYSRYVHVGPAAEECPEGEDGRCTNGLHFHAWVRLPNPFQRSSIVEKASAASARRKRLLADVDSDPRVLIDQAIEEFIANDDSQAMIEEIVGADFLQDHLKAMNFIIDGDDDEESPFKHIDEDQERYRALSAMDPEARPHDEYEELGGHLKKFQDLVNAERESMEKPLRDALADKSPEELGDLVRKQRIENMAKAVFNDTYNKWEWYIGTLKPRDKSKGLPYVRSWESLEHMIACAPEVYDAIERAFTEIEAAQGRAAKNS